MEAHVERDWMRRTVKVWAYESRLRGVVLLWRGGADGWERVEVNAIEELPETPTLELPEGMLEAIVREAAGIVPPSNVTHEALVDARAVRDRLLAIVEKIK